MLLMTREESVQRPRGREFKVCLRAASPDWLMFRLREHQVRKVA